jgi:hypothetical protein
MAWVEAAANTARDNRSPVTKDNPLAQAQEKISEQIVKSLERLAGTCLSVYPKPHSCPSMVRRLLQAAVGIDPKSDVRARAAKDPLHEQLVRERIADLKSRIPEGGIRDGNDPSSPVRRACRKVRPMSAGSKPSGAFAKARRT